MGKGECKVGYAMVALSKILESNLLPSGTSAQLGELTALTRALEMSPNKRVNIYAD